MGDEKEVWKRRKKETRKLRRKKGKKSRQRRRITCASEGKETNEEKTYERSD